VASSGGPCGPGREGRGELAGPRLAALPVVARGGVKPVDTYARTQLMLLNRRQEYRDEKGDSQPAVRWLLNIMAGGVRDLYEVTDIPDPDVQAWFGLPTRAGGQFAVGEGRKALVAGKKSEAFEAILKKPSEKRTELEQKVFTAALRVAMRQKVVSQVEEATKKNGDPEKARVFRIDNDQVLGMLGLDLAKGSEL